MFKVLIRGRNCAKYISKCLNSLQKQSRLWDALVILDDPEDESYKIAKDFAIVDRRITVIKRSQRKGLAYNMYHGLLELKDTLDATDKDIAVILDADDWLREDALKIVNKAYEKGYLLTYGSYVKVSKGRRTKISNPYPECDVRRHSWRASHLKSFKYKLFKHLKAEDFKHKGDWLPAASDVALMLPLIELAGLKNCKHIHDTIYYWRDSTPFKTNVEKQKKSEKIIRKKQKKKQLS